MIHKGAQKIPRDDEPSTVRTYASCYCF